MIRRVCSRGVAAWFTLLAATATVHAFSTGPPCETTTGNCAATDGAAIAGARVTVVSPSRGSTLVDSTEPVSIELAVDWGPYLSSDTARPRPGEGGWSACVFLAAFNDEAFNTSLERMSATLRKGQLDRVLEILCLEPGVLVATLPAAHLTMGMYRLGVFLNLASETPGREPFGRASSAISDTFFEMLTFTDDIRAGVWSGSCGDLPCGAALYRSAMANRALASPPRDSTDGRDLEGDAPMLLRRSLLSPATVNGVVGQAQQCSFLHKGSNKDSIDGALAYQRDLWNSREGMPAHDNCSLALTANVVGMILPTVLEALQEAGFSWDTLTCMEAFVRRYQPGERLGVNPHRDLSDITVNCLLSKRGAFAGGMPYRRHRTQLAEKKAPDSLESSLDVVPMDSGDCLFHPGQMTHGALDTTGGVRYILILFWRVRETARGAS